MTVIIKELVVRTAVVERKDQKDRIDTQKLKSEIVKECLHQLQKKKSVRHER